MKHVTRVAACFTLLATAAPGCAPDPAPESSSVAVRQAHAQASELSPAVIAQLEQRYPVLGPTPVPAPQPSDDANPARVPDRVLETVRGQATFYADKFEGRRTASGIPFRQNQMVAAHRGYPFGTLLRVTNLRNDHSVNVRVVDRGPFGSAENIGRTIIDLSRRAAQQLGYTETGRASVEVEVLEWGDGVPRAG